VAIACGGGVCAHAQTARDLIDGIGVRVLA
jgi:hypothetical protein